MIKTKMRMVTLTNRRRRILFPRPARFQARVQVFYADAEVALSRSAFDGGTCGVSRIAPHSELEWNAGSAPGLSVYARGRGALLRVTEWIG